MSGSAPLRLAAVAMLLTMVACQARTPGGFETKMMNGIKHHVTVRGKSNRNPLEANDDNIHLGRKNFASYCATCHGNDGHASDVAFAGRVSPPIPDLASPAVQAYSDGQLKSLIENGLFPSGMPASKGLFTDEQVWQMVLYIRHLPTRK